MPELPEVESMRRNAARWTAGGRLRALELRDDRLLRSGPDLVEGLAGQPFDVPLRRGKHLAMIVGDLALVLHFRMTGKLVRLDAPPDAGRIRAVLTLDDGTRLGFKDARRLGTMDLLPRSGLDGWFLRHGLGPEPWPQRRDGAWWRQRLSGLRGPIKPALMRQDRVAGLGNIAGSEVCFRAGIDPETAVAALDARAWDAIADAVPAFVDETLALEAGDEIHFVGEPGGGESSPFAVYGRAGDPCLRCGHVVRRTVQSGRSTFSCPGCQPPR